MPDHVHLLLEPQVKEQDEQGQPVFWPLSEILHGIKSTSAHRINKAAGVIGKHVWQEESLDRMIRGAADLEEKFRYICGNPWDNGVAQMTEDYRWLWTPERAGSAGASPAAVGASPTAAPTRAGERPQAGQVAGEAPASAPEAGALPPPEADTRPVLSGDFAFRLYDTYGFPLDLTELMARERGLTVDVEVFNQLMEEQRERARRAQKKTVIELSQIETATPTNFVGYDTLETPARVIEVVQLKDKTAVILDASACYAEMGGQVGDTGELEHGSQLWRIANTQKSGDTWLHVLEEEAAEPAGPSQPAARDKLPPSETAASGEPGEPRALPVSGMEVLVTVDAQRRAAIQRHHTATHLLHWALREVVNRELGQKGSAVGPDKFTFDFNCAPLTPQQVADVEQCVNERILENAPVSWLEVKYDHIKERKDIMQFFGEKYGEWVRVVQIGGRPTGLDGYAMELCGGTHCRATGEIGLFRITAENAIAAGVRRIEAVAGLEAYGATTFDRELVRAIAEKVNSPLGELERKIESLVEQQRALEKQLKAMQQKEAAGAARNLLSKAVKIRDIPVIIENLGSLDGDTLQSMINELKGQFQGVIVLAGAANKAIALLAAVSPEFTARIQAGKLIQQIAPLVGGKGGGKPDFARGGGKEVAKIEEALARAKTLI